MKFELSLTTLLTIIFVILKLCGVIAWSWWLVFVPLWGGVVIFIVVAAFIFLCGCIAKIIEEKKNKR